MADRSAIEWTDATWNPIRARLLNKVGNKVGDKAKGSLGWHCEHVTPGCEHCYAEGMNKRLGTGLPFKPGHRKDIEIFLDEEMLTLPLRWKKPRKIFPGSMTDLFGSFVTVQMLDKIFAVMALSPQHDFQVLTKRAERMRSYNADEATPYRIARACLDLAIADKAKWTCDPWPVRSHGAIDNPDDVTMARWPLPNVWLGVSCENQEQADARIPLLLQTPAAVRFVSAEPLLGPIDLHPTWLPCAQCKGRGYHLPNFAANFVVGCGECDKWARAGGLTLLPGQHAKPGERIDWLIAGGESGPKARPMHPDWARGIRDQCKAAGVAFHFKQWGEWGEDDFSDRYVRTAWLSPDGTVLDDVLDVHESNCAKPCRLTFRLGKKAAGRLLDGVEHNAFPAGRG